MKNHDILLAPSVTAKNGDKESGLLVLKEAMATGLATIGTFHGGLPEIIQHEQTGFLVQEKDIYGLYEYLKILVNDYTLREEFGKNGRAFIGANYDIEKQNALLESYFQDVIG